MTTTTFQNKQEMSKARRKLVRSKGMKTSLLKKEIISVDDGRGQCQDVEPGPFF
jgi:hypothetical protein